MTIFCVARPPQIFQLELKLLLAFLHNSHLAAPNIVSPSHHTAVCGDNFRYQHPHGSEIPEWEWEHIQNRGMRANKS